MGSMTNPADVIARLIAFKVRKEMRRVLWHVTQRANMIQVRRRVSVADA